MGAYHGLKKTTKDNKFILAGIGLAALFLVLEASVHVFVLHEGSLMEEILVKDPHEVALRLLIIALFIALGAYAQASVKKQKIMDEKLVKAVKEWEQTFDTMPDPVAILDKQYRVVRINSPMAGRLGVTPEKAVGSFCYKLVHNMDNPPCYCPHSKLLEDSKEHSVEIHEERMGGDFFVSVSPMFDAAGHLAGCIHVARDITERKLAEDALRNSEKKLRDITSSLGEGIYVMDEKGRILFMNPEAERLLGWNLEELMDKNVHDIVHNKRADGAPLSFDDCPVHSVLKTGIKYFSYEDVFIRKDGTVFPISVTANPIIEDNRVLAVVTAFRDISERKKAEREREKLVNELQDALAKVKQLSGMLPICASCKKIRDDRGYWNQIEVYIRDHSEAEFTHGLCPDCLKKAYKELEDLKEGQEKRNKNS